MIYIICIQKDVKGKITGYRAFETRSKSKLELTLDCLRRLILNSTIKVVNATIKNNSIVIKEWANRIATEINESGLKEVKIEGCKFILLAKKDDLYNIIKYNGEETEFITKKMLIDITAKGIVANCRITEMAECNKTETEDVYTIQEDREFEAFIKEKYNIFIAKTKMLGYKTTTFEYNTENKEVRLTKYTGREKDAIIPPFVTAIKENAFNYRTIEALRLSEGLKVIGTDAFNTWGSSEGFKNVVIPSTVELIGNDAFRGNFKLAHHSGAKHKKYFEILSEKTIVLDQGI